LEDLRDMNFESLSGGLWCELYENEKGCLFFGQMSDWNTIVPRCSKLKEYQEAWYQFEYLMKGICFSQSLDSDWQSQATVGVATVA
jgi:hypothetical protein